MKQFGKIALAVLFFFVFLVVKIPAFAADIDLVINEVMYDFAGSDDNHEWVELRNTGNEPVTVIGGSGSGSWRIHDGANHIFNTTAAQGSMTILAGDFAIITQDSTTFLSDYPGFSGTLIQSSGLSLGNTADVVSLRIGTSGSLWGDFLISRHRELTVTETLCKKRRRVPLLLQSQIPEQQMQRLLHLPLHLLQLLHPPLLLQKRLLLLNLQRLPRLPRQL